MTRRTALVAAAVAGALALTGCGANNFRDVEGVTSQNADSYTLISNADQFPNLIIVCWKGVAFVTANRDYKPWEHVAELDKTCPGYAAPPPR